MHRTKWYCRALVALALGSGVSAWGAREERWVKIETPYFTIYSENNEKVTRDWAAKFEEFRVQMGETLHLTPTQLPPVQVMIFRSDEALKPFKPANRFDRSMNLMGFTTNNPLMTTVSLSFDGTDEFTGFSIFYGGGNWFLGGLEAGGPGWFRTGFAEVFSVYDVDGDEARLGAPRKQHVTWIVEHGLLPMDRFLTMDAYHLPAQDDDRTKAYQAQCWALVHYLLFGRGKEGVAQLGNYLASGDTAAGDEAFVQAFGPLADVQVKLRAYIRGRNNEITRVKFDRAGLAKTFKVTEAAPVEVYAAKGHILLLNGDDNGARTYFEQARILGGGGPKPLEGLGDLAYLRGDADEAVRKWTDAVAAGSTNFNVYCQLANALMRSNPGFASGRVGDVNSKLARQVVNYLEHAINLNPYYIKSFDALPYLLGYHTEPGPDDARFLELGLQLMPGNAALEAGLAAVAVKSGKLEEARGRLEKLHAPGRALPNRTERLVKYLETRLEFSDGVGRVEALLAEKKGEEAEEVIGTLLRSPMPAGLRAKLGERRTYAGELQVLQQIDQAMAEARWGDAEILARPLVESASAPEVTAQAKARLEEIGRHKKT